MLELLAPFYGKISHMSVNPTDNTLWVLTAHPNGRPIAPTRIDLQGLNDGAATLDAIQSVDVDGVAIDILGHNTGLYVLNNDGKVHRLSTSGDGFEEVFDCGPDFGLQGIVDFADGLAEYPALVPDGSIMLVGGQNRKLVLVGTESVYVIDVAEDGSFSIGTTLVPSMSLGKITSWAAHTVFGADGSQTHHCAFGCDSGALTAYFTDENTNNFNTLGLMHASEVEVTADNPLHEGAVTALIYVQDVDAKGRHKRFLVSTGIDMKLFQTSLLEGIAIPRKNQHAGRITDFVAGGFADGDGSYRGPKFGRFYTLSTDGTVKAWLNEYTNEQTSVYSTQASVGTRIMLSTQHTSGVYSEGEYLGGRLPTPHLVLARNSVLTIVALETTAKKDVQQLSDLRQNGRIAKSAKLTITSGKSFVSHMGWHDDAKVRMDSLNRFKSWDAEWLMDLLQELASEDDYSIAYREAAISAMRDSSHPRRIVLLEQMLQRWGNAVASQKMAYEALKGIFTDSLRPQRLVLETGGEENKLYVIGDLAQTVIEKGPLRRDALQMLQKLVTDKDYDLALRAYDHICGEGDLTPVMPGVEGVLYGIHSSRTDIRREMAVRLANRGLMDAFETTLILRRLLEASDESIRERAIDVSLLRAPQVASVLRFGDAALHARLYVLVNGPFASTDDQETLLRSTLPTSDEVERLSKLFKDEDASIQADLDVLVEFSTCTMDDVAVYALQARASFGFEAAAQGLLKLSNSSNEKVMRQALVGLGYMVHLDDAHDRLCGVTLSKSTPFEIGCVSIYHAIKGFELRGEDPVQNILRKVLDGGHPKLRETVVVIAQQRLNDMMPALKKERTQDSASKSESTEPNTNVSVEKEHAEELAQIEKEIQDTTEMLELGQNTKNVTIVNMAIATLQSLKSRKRTILGTDASRGVASEEQESNNLEATTGFGALKRLLKDALQEETLHENVRSEVYKTFWMHNLESASFSADKTDTLTLFLNLRDSVLFHRALKDLCTHIADPTDRKWALQLFKQLIDKEVVPGHHSNVWSIWTTVADFAETESFEPDVLRIGFDSSAPCLCKIHGDGSSTVCDKHRIRRNAFLRVLSASGDWLADFIREALENVNGRNSSAGDSAAILAVSNKAKEAVAKMDNPSEFILSMLTGPKTAQKEFACELLMMYPRFYTHPLQEAFYDLRKEALIVSNLSMPEGSHLMTSNLFEYFFKEVLQGRTEFLFVGLERFAIENGRTDVFAKALYKQGDLRLVRKALNLATQYFDGWGEEMIESALKSDDAIAKIAFNSTLRRLKREATRLNNDNALKDFVMDFYMQSSVVRQTWVVETLKLDDAAAKWELDLLQKICASKADDIRERGFVLLNAMQQTDSWDKWMVELLKQGMMDANSTIADLCFQGLLAVNKLLGPDEERLFLSKIVREDKRNQERAVALALQTTASWRIPFIVEALNDEDANIRSMMCEKVQGISGLDDNFFQDLMNHQHEDVREMSTQVLTARGLYRSKSSVSGSLKDIILRDPPKRPEYNDFKDGNGDINWGRFSSARMVWYQQIRSWKDAKIDAIISAGKTHDTAYFDVFKSVLSKWGYSGSINALWNNAVYATSWYADDWKEFVILHSGWVLQESKDVQYAHQEAESQQNDRLRVAWNVACTRAGRKDNLQWLVQKYHDYSWRNYFRKHIKREYLFEGMFAVDSSPGWDSKSEGAGFTIMQRLMTDQRKLVNDIFRLNMLRLSQQGGPVDFIAIGYTSNDDQTVLESVQMRELQYSKDALFEGVVAKLNEATIPSQNPYELSNVGGNWYDVVRLTLSLHTISADVSSEVSTGHWRNVANMISCHHPQLRARAVNAYFKRHMYGQEKERFVTDIENFSRQLVNTTVDSFPLLQDGKRTSQDKASELAYDAYMGLIRKTDFDDDLRGDALTYISEMCERGSEVEKALPVLRAALSMTKDKIRFQAYRMLITLQNGNHSMMSLNQLTQMGLRSTDERLKRMAISLIWCTDQLSKTEKIAQLESTLKNANDMAARYAFDVLHTFAGRPAAWDQADADKETALQSAAELKDKVVERLNAELKVLRDTFDEYRDDVNGQLYEIQSEPVKDDLRKALKERRTTFETESQQIRSAIQEATEAYHKSVEEAEQAHKSSMSSPLSDVDQETWVNACARRDELVGLAIDAYYSRLRIHAIDSGLTELARRRPYFEKQAEEFSGYYVRLLSILKIALQSPYNDLVRHTALSMASKRFSEGYQTLLTLLASHDEADQEKAIEALVQLGPIALTEYKDENGKALPRTAILLLDRVVNDEFGTIEGVTVFNALGQLGDRHASVRDRLFTYLNKGIESSDYSAILQTLLRMTNCGRQILKSTDWADLTPSNFDDLQKYLHHQLDWQQVDLAMFETLYDEVYGEGLLADIMNNLIDRGDYGNLTGWPDVISMAERTKGFDVFEASGERIEPINAALRRLALLPNTPDVQYVRERGINALKLRLANIGRMRTMGQDPTFIAQTLVEVLEANVAVIDDQVLGIAQRLANNKQGALSTSIFDVLYTVATTQTEHINRRIKAIKTLGNLGDERSVVALLNVAGFDAYGEELVLDPELPAQSSSVVQRLQNAASEGLGGMIFAQEREGVYQLLSKMSRSRDKSTSRKGFEGLRYFLRSDAHALSTTAMFASRYQAALNADNSEVSFFAGLLVKALTPLATEAHPDNVGLAISSVTEATVKAYILATFFGERFELEGEVFNPLNIQKSVFEPDYNKRSNVEMIYQVVRQWIHGPHQSSVDTGEGETPINFAYLKDLTVEERIQALKAERKLFESRRSDNKYTIDATRTLAKYLSPVELLDLAAYAEKIEMSKNNSDRYNIVFNAFIHATPSPIEVSLNRLKEDFVLDLQGDLSEMIHVDLVLELFQQNTSALGEHMNEIIDLMQWFHMQLDQFIQKRRFGDMDDFMEHRLEYFDVLRTLLNIARQFPTHSALVSILEGLLDVCHLMNGEEWKHNAYEDLFETYLEYGQVDWNLVDHHLNTGGRNLRMLVVSYLDANNAAEILPRVFKWIEDDAAALSRLVDVLSNMSDELQQLVVAQLKDTGSSKAVLLVLTRLHSVDAFKTVVDSFRDAKGVISAEVGVRSATTPSSTESTYSPLLVETVFNSLAMVATDKAEYYLRDLSADITLDYAVRQAAAKAANVAYRRRVPLHIRRAERS